MTPDQNRESVLARIRRRRESLARDRHIDIDLPGYGGDVLMRFGPLAWEAIAEIQERVQKTKGPRRLVEAQADFLIAACRGILFRVGDDLVPIAEGDEVRFDARLAAALGLSEFATSARTVLFEAFALTNAPDLAVATVATELGQWMGETDVDLDEILLGE